VKVKIMIPNPTVLFCISKLEVGELGIGETARSWGFPPWATANPKGDWELGIGETARSWGFPPWATANPKGDWGLGIGN